MLAVSLCLCFELILCYLQSRVIIGRDKMLVTSMSKGVIYVGIKIFSNTHAKNATFGFRQAYERMGEKKTMIVFKKIIF